MSVGDELSVGERYEAALAVYEFGLSFDPSNLGVRERVAKTLGALDRLEAACAQLHQTIDIADDEASKAWLYFDLGGLIDRLHPAPGVGAGYTWGGGGSSDAVEVNGEALSAEGCFRRAVDLDPALGEAHKALADAVVAKRGAALAHGAFRLAAHLMPDDVCCATHVFYYDLLLGAHDERDEKRALPMIVTRPPDDDDDYRDGEEFWAARAALAFEREGYVVLEDFAPAAVVAALEAATRAPDLVDVTGETRNAACRSHRALPLDGSVVPSLSPLCERLWPLVARILSQQQQQQEEEEEATRWRGKAEDDALNIIDEAGGVPVLGLGFMAVDPGARAQELHKDSHGVDRHGDPDCPVPGAPRAVSIQIQLTDTSLGDENGPPRGSLEVLPGSHRPDAANGAPDAITTHASSSAVRRIEVAPGTCTLYSSRLWHRGGANDSDRQRKFVFLTLTEPGAPAPPGLIHTLHPTDVGHWLVDGTGLRQRQRRP